MPLNVKVLTRVAQGAGLGCLLAAASASAAPITFTWDPQGAGLGTPSETVIGPADNFTAVDLATINLASSGFTEFGSLNIDEFLLGSGLAPSDGLLKDYSLLVGFSGTGGAITVPDVGMSSTAPFTSLNYTLYGYNGIPTPTITPTTNVDIANYPGLVPLAYGSLLTGTATLTNVPPAPGQIPPLYSATANLNLTMNPCTAAGLGNNGVGNSLCTGDESSFFASPSPMDISLLIGNFSATTSVTTLSGDTLTIDGGGGNLTLASEASLPEPATLMIIGLAFSRLA